MSKKIREKMAQGLADEVFPGATLLVAHRNEIVFHEAFGVNELGPKQSKITRDTYFDIASLTKPLATAAATAILFQQGDLALDDPLKRFIPKFSGGDKDQVTLVHLLTHSSGLPDWKPYFKEIAKREAVEAGFLGSPEAKRAVYQMAHQETLIARPGKQSCYSDIGFILLGRVVEKAAGMPLDDFCERKIFTHLDAPAPRFIRNSATTAQQLNDAVAATEDLAWRKGVIRGIVHDDNAYAMGGVAGHAGVFATAFGVYQLVRLWLDAISGSGIFNPKIAARFFRRQQERLPESSSWALGWDTPSPASQGEAKGLSSSGRFFSKKSVGHLGYTGTSIWIDPENHLCVILLSNRVHPSHENKKIQSFRPELHDVVFKEVLEE